MTSLHAFSLFLQLIEPIASLVPDAFSDFLDIEEMFDDTVEKIVSGAIDAGKI